MTAALLQPDGKIIVAGRVGVDGGASAGTGLGRYTSTGALDLADFGHTTGIVRIDLSASGHDHDSPSGVALTADGKIVLGVETTQVGGVFRHALARLDTHGILDDSFGTHGTARNSFAAGGDFARAIAIQADGRIVAARRRPPIPSGRHAGHAPRRERRARRDLRLERQSGRRLLLPADGAETLLIQPDGKIVAAGVARNANTNSLAIVRVVP